MNSPDTSPEARKVLIGLLKRRTPQAKLQDVMSAMQAAQALVMARIRMENPGMSERDVWKEWARIHLGHQLFECAYGKQRE